MLYIVYRVSPLIKFCDLIVSEVGMEFRYTVPNIKVLAMKVVESADDATVRNLASQVTIIPELAEVNGFVIRSAINALTLDYLNKEFQFHIDVAKQAVLEAGTRSERMKENIKQAEVGIREDLMLSR